MKTNFSKFIKYICYFIFLICISTAVSQVKHKILMVDNGKNQLILLDEIDNKGWTVKIPGGSRDISLLEGDKILVSHGYGAAEYSLSDGSKLSWESKGFKSVNSARRLANGNTLLGTDDGKLIEVDKTGQEVKTVKVNGASSVRQIRLTKQGTVLFTIVGPYRVVETDREGKILWSAKLTGKGYTAFKLPNGNVLATTGETCTIIEINPEGEVVNTLGGKDAHKGQLWYSGLDTLANGNIVVANWNGHGKKGQGPHVVEFDKNNKLVWSWEDHNKAATITNLLVIDDSKAPKKVAVFKTGTNASFHYAFLQGRLQIRLPNPGLLSLRFFRLSGEFISSFESAMPKRLYSIKVPSEKFMPLFATGQIGPHTLRLPLIRPQ